MEFDLGKTEQELKDALRIKDGQVVNWVRSVDGMQSGDLHSHFEVELSDSPKIGEQYVIASFRVPNYNITIELLEKHGTVTEKLKGYLITSFLENQSQYLNVSNFHINWNSNQN